MEFMRLCVLALVCAFLCVSAQAQGHYQLKYSDLLQNCSFIHRDEFSLSAFQDLVKAQLEARVDGDNQCQAAYRSLNANLENMLKLVNEEVSAQDARKLYGEMYGEYLVSLETELALLDLSNSQQAARASVLQGQIDALRRGLLDNKYEMQLYSRTSQTTILQQSQQQLFGNISSVVQSLSQMPTNCVGKIGGWQQIMPVLLNATSFIGMATGQLYLPAAAATVQVGTEVAMILSNAGVKKALTRLVAQRNNQILACTYQSITYQACELKRAAESVADTAKVEDIINNRYGEGDEGEYERFVRAQQMLPKIRQIMTKVGEMGSAVTLNLELIFRYFAAVRVRPYEIVVPAANSPDEVLARWLNDMSNRGIDIPDNDNQGLPLTIRQKYERTITTIENYKVTITTVIATIREKRSFKDLRDELILQSRNLSRELQFLNSFLVKFPNEKTELPAQYKSLFVATERMLTKIQKFIDVEQIDGETYEDFIKRVDTVGEEMFAEFSYGSVAQVTSQTVLMIPQIAFERFERREEPTHVSYATYMINRSVQIRVLNLYKNLSASGQAFRLEAFETTKNSFERGFRKEIRKMIDESLENESPILGTVLKGKTSAHLCALFSDHLRRENPKLWRRCQSTHESLPLYQVMRNYRRPIELKIDYQDPCFYNSYRREEFAQSLLFDRLLEYGFSQKKK